MIFSRRVTGWVITRDLAAIFTAYFLGLFLAPRALFLETLNGMLLGISMAVAYIYSVRLPTIIQQREIGLALIRTGIIGSWTVCAIQAGVRVYFFEFMPGTQGRAFDATGGAFAIGYIIFAALHIIAINVLEDRLSRAHLSASTWAVLGGAAFVFIMHAIHLYVR